MSLGDILRTIHIRGTAKADARAGPLVAVNILLLCLHTGTHQAPRDNAPAVSNNPTKRQRARQSSDTPAPLNNAGKAATEADLLGE